MILRHIITLNGQPITVPIDDEHIDAEYEKLKAQIASQGGDPNILKIHTDVELEEGEYDIQDIGNNTTNWYWLCFI